MEENYIYLQFYWIKMLKVDSFCLVMQLIFIWVRIYWNVTAFYSCRNIEYTHWITNEWMNRNQTYTLCTFKCSDVWLLLLVRASSSLLLQLLPSPLTWQLYNLIWFDSFKLARRIVFISARYAPCRGDIKIIDTIVKTGQDETRRNTAIHCHC